MTADWPSFLDDPQSIYSLYDEGPDLSRCDLFHMLADERKDSITLGFQTAQTPERIRPEWREKEYNSFTFYLFFSGVHELDIRGWGNPGCKEVSIQRKTDENLVVTITSEGSSATFRARTVSLAAARVGLVSQAS
ncbi:Imm50 family immunity protein [Streptomyces rubiginosohelvolus]|uniref:Imm50 family immunity protein n=1 Tax=Streptomyces rubiginosohelvolus TaxID=67362 RepID=UPI0033F2DA8C